MDNEETLDPADWSSFRDSAHAMLDDMIDHLAGLNDQPVWQAPSTAARQALTTPLPKSPTALDAVYQDFREHVLPFATGNAHARFFGWVMGNGTADGMMAEMLAAAMNAHLGGYDQGPTLVERQVLLWLTQIMAYPESAGGLLVSGGTMANLIGLMVARNQYDTTIGRAGVAGAGRLTVYASTETHSWVEKAADILGLGRDSVRRVACDSAGRLDVKSLRDAVAADRENGFHPFCVVGTAGTVDRGVVDDLEELADFCGDESLWFHVDGAFGALLALAPGYRHRLKGMERSDSLAFDLHKWGYLQYEVGCVLVRDAQLQRQAFETAAAYLAPAGRGIQPESLEFAAMGTQLSRGFRALKVWMGLRHHGTNKIGRLIEQNIRQAQYLLERIQQHPQLEQLGPAPLNIVCFRYRPTENLSDTELDALNLEILLNIQESGEAVLSSTVRDGCFALRVNITNHRTRMSDIDRLISTVESSGNGLLRGLKT